MSRRASCPFNRDGWLSITESWNSSRAAWLLGLLPLYLFLTTPPRTEFWDRAGLVITSRGPGSRSSRKKRVLLWQPLNNLLYHMTTEKRSWFYMCVCGGGGISFFYCTSKSKFSTWGLIDPCTVNLWRFLKIFSSSLSFFLCVCVYKYI